MLISYSAAVPKLMRRVRTIRFYALALASIGMIPLMIWITADVLQRIENTEAEQMQKLKLVAMDVSADVARTARATKHLLDAIGTRAMSRGNFQCESWISDFIETSGIYSSFFAVTPDGEIICNVSKSGNVSSSNENLLDTITVRRAFRVNKFDAGFAQQGIMSRRWVALMSSPVKNGAGNETAYMFISVQLEALAHDLFAGRSDAPTINVIDGNGQRIIRWPSPEQWFGKLLRFTATVGEDAGDGVEFVKTNTSEGIEVLAARVPVAGTDWRVTVSTPRGAVVEAVERRAVYSIGGISVMFILLSSAAYAFARRFSRPIEEVAEIAISGRQPAQFSPAFTPSEIFDTAFAITRLNDALTQSEERYIRMIEASPVACLLVSANNTTEFVNPAFTSLFGYTIDDVPDLNAWHSLANINPLFGIPLVSDDRSPTLLESTAQVIRTKGGRDAHVLMYSSRAQCDDPYHLLSYVDVTESSEHHAKDKLYAQIWRQSSDCLLVKDADHKIVEVNPAALDILGYQAEELIGKDITYLLADAEEAERNIRFRNSADASGVAVTRQRLRRKAGAEFNVLTTIVPLRDDAGDIAKRLVIFRDQTHEEKHRAELEKYSHIVKSVWDPIVSADANGVIMLCNPAALTTFGYSEAELIGKPLAILLPSISDGAERDGIKFFFRNHAESKAAQLHLVDGVRKDGGKLRLQISVSKSLYAGVETATVVIRDVTTSQSIQEQLHQADKLAALGQLAGGIAHDVNNDLAVVMASAELMLNDETSSDPSKLLAQRIVKTVARSSTLVKRLLSFSRKTEIVFADVDLAVVVPELLETIHRTIGTRIQCSSSILAKPAWIRADRSIIESCILNLCINARDAMPSGGTLTLTVDTEQNTPDGRSKWALLRVSDTGTGMSPDIRMRIFEPFFTTKSTGHGTGLGLSMVYGFVKQCAGDIEVVSELGAGSTFILKFPSAVGASTLVDHHSYDGNLGGGEAVLIVDDNDLVRTTLKEQLQAIGYVVVEAQNVEQAITVLEVHENVRAVLTDMDLGPGQTGVELAQWIARERPWLPGALITGNATETAENQLPAKWQTLHKPLPLKALAQTLGRLLHR